MRRLLAVILLLSVIISASCNRTDVTEETSSVEHTTVQTSETVSTTAATTTEFTYEAYIPEYDIDQTFLNVTFEDVYNLCEEWTGVDLDELVQNSEDNSIIVVEQDGLKIEYIADYPKYLDMICRPEYNYRPEEHQLHTLRRIYINGLAINEYEDEYWAKFSYCQDYDFYSDEGRILDESDLSNGYFYSYSDDIHKYFVHYISNNCVVSYEHSMNGTDNSDFITYLEICDRTGLPTSSEMIDAIGT